MFNCKLVVLTLLFVAYLPAHQNNTLIIDLTGSFNGNFLPKVLSDGSYLFASKTAFIRVSENGDTIYKVTNEDLERFRKSAKDLPSLSFIGGIAIIDGSVWVCDSDHKQSYKFDFEDRQLVNIEHYPDIWFDKIVSQNGWFFGIGGVDFVRNGKRREYNNWILPIKVDNELSANIIERAGNSKARSYRFHELTPRLEELGFNFQNHFITFVNDSTVAVMNEIETKISFYDVTQNFKLLRSTNIELDNFIDGPKLLFDYNSDSFRNESYDSWLRKWSRIEGLELVNDELVIIFNQGGSLPLEIQTRSSVFINTTPKHYFKDERQAFGDYLGIANSSLHFLHLFNPSQNKTSSNETLVKTSSISAR